MSILPPPRELLALAVKELGPLASEAVFVGGAVVGLLAVELDQGRVRPTEDVDLVFEAATKAQYDIVDSKLRKMGFQNDMFGPICRYRKGILVLDVVPTKGEVLGFSNEWYGEGVAKALSMNLKPSLSLKVIFPPCFIASKLSAFLTPHREGAGDLLASRDFADIVTVIGYRPTLVEESAQGSSQLRQYLSSQFESLLLKRAIEEGVASALDPDAESQGRRHGILDSMRQLSALRQ